MGTNEEAPPAFREHAETSGATPRVTHSPSVHEISTSARPRPSGAIGRGTHRNPTPTVENQHPTPTPQPSGDRLTHHSDPHGRAPPTVEHRPHGPRETPTPPAGTAGRRTPRREPQAGTQQVRTPQPSGDTNAGRTPQTPNRSVGRTNRHDVQAKRRTPHAALRKVGCALHRRAGDHSGAVGLGGLRCVRRLQVAGGGDTGTGGVVWVQHRTRPSGRDTPHLHGNVWHCHHTTPRHHRRLSTTGGRQGPGRVNTCALG